MSKGQGKIGIIYARMGKEFLKGGKPPKDCIMAQQLELMEGEEEIMKYQLSHDKRMKGK
ncbi:hypothetical protein AGMMS49928_09260 [Spirochaetia bacterium]|nr:hypothetical protein AGMMS49928_09260 [Spirochaetia bacterium]